TSGIAIAATCHGFQFLACPPFRVSCVTRAGRAERCDRRSPGTSELHHVVIGLACAVHVPAHRARKFNGFEPMSERGVSAELQAGNTFTLAQTSTTCSANESGCASRVRRP